MASIVESDSSVRIVIPKKICDQLGINPKTQLLLTTNMENQILLQKLDIEEIAQKLKDELKDTPIEETLKKDQRRDK